MRNVPDDVAARLEGLAERAGMSVSAYCVRVLAEVAKRADNPAILADLPHLGIGAEAVVEAVATGRAERTPGSAASTPRTDKAGKAGPAASPGKAGRRRSPGTP